MQTVQLCAI